MSEVTDDLACDWHTVMGSVVLFGQVLIDDPIRYATVAAIGSDEALCKREGWRRKQRWSTQIVDVEHDPLYGCRRRLVMPASASPSEDTNESSRSVASVARSPSGHHRSLPGIGRA